jgi:hypothetical protein
VHPVLTEEGGVLLDERTGRWTQLTPTAAVALHLLLNHPGRDQAAAAYARWFGLPGEQAEQDLAAVARDLAARGLLAHPRPRRRRRRWWR